MKIFAAIFSLYIVALVAFPCVDNPGIYALQKSGIAQQATDSHQHNDKDHCSPFCYCNCCGCPVIQQELAINFESIPFQLETFSPELANLFVSRPIKTIWQPPKIG